MTNPHKKAGYRLMTIEEIRRAARRGLYQAEKLRADYEARAQRKVQEAIAWGHRAGNDLQNGLGQAQRRMDASARQTAQSAEQRLRSATETATNTARAVAHRTSEAIDDGRAWVDSKGRDWDEFRRQQAKFLEGANLYAGEAGFMEHGYRKLVKPSAGGPWERYVGDDDLSRLAAGKVYAAAPGERFVIGVGPMEGRRMPEQMGRALGAYRDPDTGQVVTLKGDFSKAWQSVAELEDAEELRRQALLAEVDARREATTVGGLRLQAGSRGALDGLSLNAGPYIIAGVKAPFGGSFRDNMHIEEHIVRRDKAEFPVSRAIGEVAGSAIGPKVGILGKVAGRGVSGAIGGGIDAYVDGRDIGTGAVFGAASDIAFGGLADLDLDRLQRAIPGRVSYDGAKLFQDAARADSRSWRNVGPTFSPSGRTPNLTGLTAAAADAPWGTPLRSTLEDRAALAVRQVQATQAALKADPASAGLKLQLKRDTEALEQLRLALDPEAAGAARWAPAVADLGPRSQETLMGALSGDPDSLGTMAETLPVYQFVERAWPAVRNVAEAGATVGGKAAVSDPLRAKAEQWIGRARSGASR
jgi:hypothetical protein